MMRVRSFRTTGIRKYMTGKAIAQDIIQDSPHLRKTPSAYPSARNVATPETRQVMIRVRTSGSATGMMKGGSFFTAVETIWYGP